MFKPAPTPGDTTWFVHDRFGMFIHWGLYALPARHEWVKNMERISDEDYQSFGLSGEIATIVSEHLDTVRLKSPVRRLAVPDVPIPFSRPLEQFVIPQVDSIVAAVKAQLDRLGEAAP